MARPEFTPDGGSKEVLLEVKTTLPVLHYPQIIRPRLRNILEDAWNHPVTCLTAPAGSGKTTALVQAVMADQRPVAWLTLDPSDDDYARFWRYVFLALSTINPGLAEWGEEFRAALAAENNEMVPVFLDQMAHSEIDGLLILDGVEHLIQPTIRESLREVLSYLPDRMHVILSGRMDSLELSQRLDLTGLVIRRDPAELNFTREEIEAYCQLHAVNLDARSLASLVYCSEGWPAGVAGLLQPLIQGDRETLGKVDCQNLNETLAAYIQEEILRDLDPDELDFLTKTSILSKLNPEACRLLTGVESSAELLNHLCHGPLLMEAIPGRPDQYRIHRLIRLVLTRQLHQRYGETAQLIHRRAADWYSARSEWGKAFRCLKGNGTREELAAFVRSHGPEQLRIGESRQLAIWLPETTVAADGQLLVLQAWTALLHRHYALLQRTLEFLDEWLANQPQKTNSWKAMQSERLILQAMWSLAREQLPAVIRDMTAAAEVSRNSYLFSHGIDLTDGQLYLTGGLLGLYGKRSLWTEAFYESIRRIEQVWGARGIRQILMGEDLFERNHLAEACPHFLQGMNEAMFHHCNGGVTAAALGISRVRRAAGDPEGARQIIDEARLWLSRHEIHHQDPPLDAWEALLDQENGQLDAASQWIRHSHLLTGAAFQGDRLFEELILARLLLDQGRLTECQGRLNELIILLETEPSILYEIMVYLLMALCSHRLDQAGEVRRLIGEALSLSAAEGYCRIWLDLAPGLKPLLEEWNREETGQLTGYASGLLAIWEQNEGGENLCSAGMADGSQNLTDREQEVLRRLNEGMSNKEIAQKLHITVATTKFHCSNIYRKLNVDHRQAAIQRARNKGLI